MRLNNFVKKRKRPLNILTRVREYPRLGLVLLAYVAFIALGMPDGLLGVEAEFSHVPRFFEGDSEFGLVLTSRVSTLSGSVVLAVPLYDMIVVSMIRIRRGRSPFVGDTNHFSHRLVARGMSRRTAVLAHLQRQVIEHVFDPYFTLGEIRRVLAPRRGRCRQRHGALDQRRAEDGAAHPDRIALDPQRGGR